MNTLTRIFAVVLLAVANIAMAATYLTETPNPAYGWITPATQTDVPFTGTCSSGGTGTLDDTISTPITLPFTFFYGGAARTTVQVSTNGRLQFGGNNYCGTNSVPTNTTMRNTMAPGNGADFDLRTTGLGTTCDPSATAPNTCYVKYGTTGASPNRQFVVSFVGVPRYNVPGARNTFQIILNESDGSFVYQYNTLGAALIPAWEISSTDYTLLSTVSSSSGAARRFYLAPPPALRALYTLDGSATSWTDSSGAGAANASVVGTTTSVTPATPPGAKVCKAASIPSNTTTATIDAVALPFTLGTDAALKTRGSISFWWSSTTAWNSGTAAQILDATTVASRYFYLVRTSGNRLYARIHDSNTTSRTIKSGTFSYAANTWHHITWTWDFPAGLMALYVDGALVGSTTLTTTRTLNASIGSVYLGDNRSGNTGTNGTGRSATGYFDEIRVYSGAVTAPNIVSDMAVTRACIGALDHIRLEHDGAGSNCAPEAVKVIACGDINCSTFYTGGVSNITLTPTTGVTWTPATVSIPVGSSFVNATVANAATGPVTLGAGGTPSPTPAGAADCKNIVSGALSCTMTFGASLGFNIPNHVAGTPQTASICGTSAFAGTTKPIKFWSTYLDPSTGTQKGTLTANGAGPCATPGTASTLSATPTVVNLTFSSGSSPTATVGFCYPDVGQVKLDACYDGTSTATACPGGSTLGSATFVAKPYNFTVTGTGIPGTASPSGTIFKKAGAPFTASITAKNALGATTPNFGKEATPEGVILTPTVAAPSAGDDGTLSCNGLVGGCTIGGSQFTSGAATLADFSWDEVGAMKIMPLIADADYLGTGQIAPAAADATSGVIGRFTPDHFVLTGAPSLQARSGRGGCWGLSGSSSGDMTAGSADLTITGVTLATTVTAGDGVVVVGAGAGGADLYAMVVSYADPVITLDTAASTTVTGTPFFQRVGYSYMAEGMLLNFQVEARNAADQLTANYQSSVVAADNFSRFSTPVISGVVATGSDGWGLAMAGGNPFVQLSGRAAVFTGYDGTVSWANGVGSFQANVQLTLPGAMPDGPYDWLALGVAPVDKDGIGLSTTEKDLQTGASGKDRARVGVASVRQGRLKLNNVLGSERLPVSIPVRMQFFNGSTWVTSTDDNCTPISRDTSIAHTLIDGVTPITEQFSPTGLTTTVTVGPPTVTTAGLGQFNLTTPGARGYIDLTWPVKPYMQFPWMGGGVAVDPKARITFGLYKTPVLDLRERY